MSHTPTEDFHYDEAILVRNATEIPTPNMSDDDEEMSGFGARSGAVVRELIDTDSEDDTSAFILKSKQASPKLLRQQSSSARPPSAGPSHRRTSLRSHSPALLDIQRLPEPHALSDSDSDDTHQKNNKITIPGEYDPALYENLNVNEESKEVFQYITKYVPQHLNVDFKFKPFIPEYLPAVGDIDAFLKVIPPETTLAGKRFDSNKLHLGLAVLDEPAANQSDPALLHLRLRSSSVHSHSTANVVVKTVDDVARNAKVIDKWMKDVSDLHKTKSSPIVKYSDPMPNLDDLMQEWPENMENLLKIHGFPNSKFSGSLSQYINVVCSILDIPVYKNKILSLHLLFCLYAAVKNSQIYQTNNASNKSTSDNYEINKTNNTTDQLVLE